ncbi:hypothetical protein ACS0TY_026946 [Phlomoides rotata]
MPPSNKEMMVIINGDLSFDTAMMGLVVPDSKSDSNSEKNEVFLGDSNFDVVVCILCPAYRRTHKSTAIKYVHWVNFFLHTIARKLHEKSKQHIIKGKDSPKMCPGKAMSIQYKYWSAVNFETVEIGNRTSISIGELGNRIFRSVFKQQGLDDLLLYDAISGQEYKDDATQIHTGSCLILKRVPGGTVLPTVQGMFMLHKKV